MGRLVRDRPAWVRSAIWETRWCQIPTTRPNSNRKAPRISQVSAAKVDLRPYLAQTSDLIALMTFEHQLRMSNLIAQIGRRARSSRAEHEAGRSRRRAPECEHRRDASLHVVRGGGADFRNPFIGVSHSRRHFRHAALATVRAVHCATSISTRASSAIRSAT